MVRYKPQLEEFARRRDEYKNFHKDIAQYLITVWEENGWRDLVILEYEQYFQIEEETGEENEKLDSFSEREITQVFQKLF